MELPTHAAILQIAELLRSCSPLPSAVVAALLGPRAGVCRSPLLLWAALAITRDAIETAYLQEPGVLAATIRAWSLRARGQGLEGERDYARVWLSMLCRSGPAAVLIEKGHRVTWAQLLFA